MSALIKSLDEYVRGLQSTEVKGLHKKLEQLMEVCDKLNERLEKVEKLSSFEKNVSVSDMRTPVKAPGTVKSPGKWIHREESEEVKFVGQSLNVVVPKNTKTIGMVFKERNCKSDVYAMYCRKIDGCTADISKLSKDHYLISINGKSTKGMSFDDMMNTITELCASGVSLRFKRLSNAQKRSIAASEESKLVGLREKLWKYYELFYTEEWRDEKASKYQRYRPGCGSCKNKTAIDALKTLLEARTVEIVKVLGKDHTVESAYKCLDAMNDDQYENILDRIENPILYETPTKKRKMFTPSLRDLFINAGHPANVYDTLIQTMSEDMIRNAFKLG